MTDPARRRASSAASALKLRTAFQALSPDERRSVTHEAMRRDFVAFLVRAFEVLHPGERFKLNWHHGAITEVLRTIEAGEVFRQIISLPPRSLKSFTISVAWVAWILGRNPGHKFMCVSYSDELGQKFTRDCAKLMREPWFKRLFPKCKLVRDTVDYLETSEGGGRYSVTVAGQITGFGADTIIIDDPMKPSDANSEMQRAAIFNWMRQTLYSRLNSKKCGSIILVMQRLHVGDLAGQLLDAGGWKELKLSAIAQEDARIPIGYGRVQIVRAGDVLHPEHEPLKTLEGLRAALGSENFAAQYLQEPVPASGAMLQASWFATSPSDLRLQPGDKIVQSWDCASKTGVMNDYSVGVTALVRKHEVHILHVVRERLEFPDLMRKVVAMAREHAAHVLLIEDAASGQQLIQNLNHEAPAGVPAPLAIKPDGDKATRMAGVSPHMEAGKLFLPADAPWRAAFLKEMLSFPYGLHDDQVDALSQLLAWVRERPVLPPGICVGGHLRPRRPFEQDYDPYDPDLSPDFHPPFQPMC